MAQYNNDGMGIIITGYGDQSPSGFGHVGFGQTPALTASVPEGFWGKFVLGLGCFIIFSRLLSATVKRIH